MSSEPQPLPPDPEEAPLPLDDALPSGGSFFDKLGPQAPMILLASSVLGAISVFLPLVFGFNTFEAGWRGKLILVGYLATAALGGLILGKTIPNKKPQALGSLITAGVVLLLEITLLFDIGGSAGIGLFIGLLAALVVTGAGVILAKDAKVF